MVLRFEGASELSRRFDKMDFWETPPGLLVHPRVTPRIGISNRFPGDAQAAGPGTTPGDPPH